MSSQRAQNTDPKKPGQDASLVAGSSASRGMGSTSTLGGRDFFDAEQHGIDDLMSGKTKKAKGANLSALTQSKLVKANLDNNLQSSSSISRSTIGGREFYDAPQHQGDDLMSGKTQKPRAAGQTAIANASRLPTGAQASTGNDGSLFGASRTNEPDDLMSGKTQQPKSKLPANAPNITSAHHPSTNSGQSSTIRASNFSAGTQNAKFSRSLAPQFTPQTGSQQAGSNDNTIRANANIRTTGDGNISGRVASQNVGSQRPDEPSQRVVAPEPGPSQQIRAPEPHQPQGHNDSQSIRTPTQPAISAPRAIEPQASQHTPRDISTTKSGDTQTIRASTRRAAPAQQSNEQNFSSRTDSQRTIQGFAAGDDNAKFSMATKLPGKLSEQPTTGSTAVGLSGDSIRATTRSARDSSQGIPTTRNDSQAISTAQNNFQGGQQATNNAPTVRASHNDSQATRTARNDSQATRTAHNGFSQGNINSGPSQVATAPPAHISGPAQSVRANNNPLASRESQAVGGGWGGGIVGPSIQVKPNHFSMSASQGVTGGQTGGLGLTPSMSVNAQVTNLGADDDFDQPTQNAPVANFGAQGAGGTGPPPTSLVPPWAPQWLVQDYEREFCLEQQPPWYGRNHGGANHDSPRFFDITESYEIQELLEDGFEEACSQMGVHMFDPADTIRHSLATGKLVDFGSAEPGMIICKISVKQRWLGSLLQRGQSALNWGKLFGCVPIFLMGGFIYLCIIDFEKCASPPGVPIDQLVEPLRPKLEEVFGLRPRSA